MRYNICMISKVTGTIVHADTRYLVLDVNGVGYKIFTTSGVLEKHMNGTASFWTYLAVRENALDLYGFPTKAELDLFELLITVSGIGPKTALGILNVASAQAINQAVFMEDAGYLTKTTGISKKNAEKIVMELKGKLGAPESLDGAVGDTGSDALDALIALGYNERNAREALKKVSKDITDTTARIKGALKHLGS